MVLRRPYAFLIKHFRLIHLFITALFGFIVYKNMETYKYINSVIKDSVNRYDAIMYIDYKIILFIVIALILCGAIFWLLKFKDKPRNIYIFTIVSYIIIAAFMVVLFNYMSVFTSEVIEQKVIRAYRDILTMTLFIQYYIVIVMLIRGLGFDIKKFNFSKDVHELNLTEEDSEEIEVAANLNTNTASRLVQKQKRELGYFYKEYKLYIISIFVLIILFLGYKGYNYFTDKLKVYHEGDVIGGINLITINDSYYHIDKTNNYVIINFDISNYGRKELLNTGNVLLKIGNKTYSPDKNVCYKFNSLGNCYKKQILTTTKTNYIFVYSVDKLDIQDAYIVYSESYDVSYKVKLVMKEA